MLERYFVRPATIERIRASWLGGPIEQYAEINIQAKEAVLAACEPPATASAALPRKSVWRNDEALLAWLASL
jgi:hypothetical protein